MREINIVVKSLLDWGTSGELRLRPDSQNSFGQNMGTGVPQSLNFGHDLDIPFASSAKSTGIPPSTR